MRCLVLRRKIMNQNKKERKKLVIAVFILSMCLLFSLIACSKKDADKKATYNGKLFFETPRHNDVVYAIQESDMTTQEKEMIVSLQGIVAKTSPAILITNDKEENTNIKTLVGEYELNIVNENDPWKLLGLFENHITQKKFVLYNSLADAETQRFDQSINYATTIAGAEGYLMVPVSLKDKAEKAGFVQGKDVRNTNTAAIFNEYKNKLNNKFLVHQSPEKWQLRDYAIAAGVMTFYSDYYDGIYVKDEILKWAADNAPVMGWTENEVNFVQSNSIHGKVTIAADWSANLSLYSSFGNNTIKQKNKVDVSDVPKNKHYVAIMMSDGDNLQWMQNGFATDKKYFGSKHRGDFPMTWTIAPSMDDLTPHIKKYLYENATDNDSFISGPSGVGYVNVSEYNRDCIEEYSSITNAYMQRMDIGYVNLIDSNVNAEAIQVFGKYENIKGGVWSVGDKYLEGEGGVYWVNDKPFVAVRESLWRIPGDDNSNKYYGYVERVAQRINEYKVSPGSIDGYTIVDAHAWSIGSMDYIKRFVDCLDEDVELVTVGQLLELVKNNVKHENKARADGVSPEDIKNLAPISTEQYRIEDINKVTVDRNRKFIFKGNDNVYDYNWRFENGGLQYDKVEYTSDGVVLDGSDLNDFLDGMPNAWMINKFKIGALDKYLTIVAHSSTDADVNFRVRALWIEGGELKSEVLKSPQYTTPLNEYDWYLMNVDSPKYYSYDISQYKEKTIALSIEQDDTGDGSGEVLTVSRVYISNVPEEENNLDSWDKYDLVAYWQKNGEVAFHSEGLCLENNGEEVSIKNNVSITTKANFLNISFRKFLRKEGETQDGNPKICVYVNGILIRSVDNAEDFVTADSDDYVVFRYNLSEYAGQVVEVKIESIYGEHACFDKVFMSNN